MAVGGIHSSFQNSYGVQKIPSGQTEQLRKPDEGRDRENVSGVRDDAEAFAIGKERENKARPLADLENISLKFNRTESFDYIGSDSSLDNLDMQKAISDMQKDQILQSYQYFVGDLSDFMGVQSSEDGTVIRKP